VLTLAVCVALIGAGSRAEAEDAPPPPPLEPPSDVAEPAAHPASPPPAPPPALAPPPAPTRAPEPDRPSRPLFVEETGNPAAIGLAAAGGAAAGSLLGVVVAGAAGFYALGLAGSQPPAVTIATAIVALGLAAATPFLSALAAGAMVILLDPRSSNEEWSGLLKCAAAGYCIGLGCIAGLFLPVGMFCSTGFGPGGMPGPDRPAEWTAGSAIAGMFGGAAVGVVVGWAVAPNPTNPTLPIAGGALGGAVIGSSVAAGVGAAIATALRP
jgi:hypothetical protein